MIIYLYFYPLTTVLFNTFFSLSNTFFNTFFNTLTNYTNFPISLINFQNFLSPSLPPSPAVPLTPPSCPLIGSSSRVPHDGQVGHESTTVLEDDEA